MKLSEKFARQESEALRLARIARRRLSKDRVESVRSFLGLAASSDDRAPRSNGTGPHVCEACGRRFALPMHLGRHAKAAHARAE